MKVNDETGLAMTIGARVKNRRKALGLTQSQIMCEVGISSGHMSNLEHGHYLPSAVTIIALANVLQCSVEWLLTGHENAGNVTAEEVEYLEAMRRLPARRRAEVMALINTISQFADAEQND